MRDEAAPASAVDAAAAEPRPYGWRTYAGRFAWGIVNRSLFRLPLPWRWRWCGFLLRAFGSNCRGVVKRSATVWHPWLLECGPFSTLSHNVTVYNLAPVRIGANTIVSQDVYFCAGTHDYRDAAMPLVRDERAAIVVGSGVWICAGVFVGPGVKIGDNSIVAARAVVTRDVPPGVIVGGNPAAVIKPREVPAASR